MMLLYEHDEHDEVEVVIDMIDVILLLQIQVLQDDEKNELAVQNILVTNEFDDILEAEMVDDVLHEVEDELPDHLVELIDEHDIVDMVEVDEVAMVHDVIDEVIDEMVIEVVIDEMHLDAEGVDDEHEYAFVLVVVETDDDDWLNFVIHQIEVDELILQHDEMYVVL